MPAYAVVNLHTSYKITPTIEVFGLVNNVFNEHYYPAAPSFKPAALPANSNVPNLLASLSDPRTFVPGIPLAAYTGIRAKF